MRRSTSAVRAAAVFLPCRPRLPRLTTLRWITQWSTIGPFRTYTPTSLPSSTVDPSSRFHFEVGGVASTVKLFNPDTQQFFTKTGAGVTMALNAELVKNFRVVTANYWNDGTGRYIFGAAPNFIVRRDGSPSLVHSASTVSGFEATIGKFAPYIYYGGVYIQRNTALDADGKTYIGYGYPGSPGSHNRSIQEITAGWTHTLWRDGRYGALQWMSQYAYFFRNPWYVKPGTPKQAHQSAVWFKSTVCAARHRANRRVLTL